MTYIITDWANNHLFQDREFSSFDEAWDFIMEKFPDDDDLEDYYAVPKSS